jgi:NADH-quinone oxidoreductase subunit N
VNLHEAISELILNTKGVIEGGPFLLSPTSSLAVFLPEITLCTTIVLMLLVRLFSWGRRIDAFYFAFLGSAVALYLAWAKAPVLETRMEFFTGMLVYDTFTVFLRSVLLLFAVLFALLTKLTGIPDREDGPDIYTLVLGATVGMCLMVSANHLVMVFMAIEMASVPSYALAAIMKGRPKASEAALKYSVYGAGTAGVMLYGISLIAGLLNTAHLPSIARALAQRLPEMQGDEQMVLALGGLMVMVGLAFKLSAVPFHFWCPDVFEGATAEVNAFLSVASKAAALGLLVRVAIGFGVDVPVGLEAGVARRAPAAQLAPPPGSSSALFAVTDEAGPGERRSPAAVPSGGAAAGEVGAAEAPLGLADVRGFIGKLIGLLAVITCTFGNLAAYGQTNIKRLLAYSTIAHAGYMMMAVPPLMALAGSDPAGAEKAVAALAIYLVVYLFMNLGAFTVVALLRNAMRSAEISDYAGLLGQCPGVVLCFSIMLFSLIGLPPLAGFIGKFAIFYSLTEGWGITGQNYLLAVLLVGAVNTAISLVYYLRIVKVMTIDRDSPTRGQVALPLVSVEGMYVIAVTLPTVVLFFSWDFLNEHALTAARQLLG